VFGAKLEPPVVFKERLGQGLFAVRTLRCDLARKAVRVVWSSLVSMELPVTDRSATTLASEVIGMPTVTKRINIRAHDRAAALPTDLLHSSPSITDRPCCHSTASGTGLHDTGVHP
jgi:hypothetical protein